MTPIQALQYLDQIASKAPVDRVTHASAQNAVKIISAALNPPKPEAKVEPLKAPEKEQ